MEIKSRKDKSLTLRINLQNFLLSNDIEPEALDDTSDIKLYMVSLYDKSNILMRFYDGNQIKIVTPNIHLAGGFIQSLAKFMNMENLQVLNCVIGGWYDQRNQFVCSYRHRLAIRKLKRKFRFCSGKSMDCKYPIRI